MENKIIAKNDDIVFYKKDNGETNIELLINGETLWVSQKTMAEIFDIGRTVITKHLKNIFNDGELDKNQVCSKMEHTASDGKTYNTEFYNFLGGKLFTDIINLAEPNLVVYSTSLFILGIGVIVGMLGSASAVKKYLKV